MCIQRLPLCHVSLCPTADPDLVADQLANAIAEELEDLGGKNVILGQEDAVLHLEQAPSMDIAVALATAGESPSIWLPTGAANEETGLTEEECQSAIEDSLAGSEDPSDADAKGALKETKSEKVVSGDEDGPVGPVAPQAPPPLLPSGADALPSPETLERVVKQGRNPGKNKEFVVMQRKSHGGLTGNVQ